MSGTQDPKCKGCDYRGPDIGADVADFCGNDCERDWLLAKIDRATEELEQVQGLDDDVQADGIREALKVLRE